MYYDGGIIDGVINDGIVGIDLFGYIDVVFGDDEIDFEVFIGVIVFVLC